MVEFTEGVLDFSHMQAITNLLFLTTVSDPKATCNHLHKVKVQSGLISKLQNSNEILLFGPALDSEISIESKQYK